MDVSVGVVQAAVEELQRGMDAARAAHATAKDRLGQVEADTQAAVEKTVRHERNLHQPCKERWTPAAGGIALYAASEEVQTLGSHLKKYNI